MTESEHDNDAKNHHEQFRVENSTINQSLYTVAKGGTIVFLGTIFGMLLGFIGRVLFARFFEASEYGIFSLGVTLAFIFASIGTIGLKEGATRQISYYRGKKDYTKVRSVVVWSLLMSVIAGVVLMLFLFTSSDFLASNVFGIPALSLALKIFSVSTPFYIFIYISVSIFRGLKKVKEKVIFEELTKNALFPVLLTIIIILGLSYVWGIITYSVSIIITSLALFFYLIRKKIVQLSEVTNLINSWGTGKELLLFSLPLMIVAILHNVLGWTDTIMLGYFLDADIVGLYNAAAPLGKFVSAALGMMAFVYLPLASEMFATDQYGKMKRSYSILTKWVCAATLPLTLVLVLFPDTVLNFFFGSKYRLAATSLQILVIGFFVNNLLGPNRELLTVMGSTSFLMRTTFIAALINIGLNVFLIPIYGLEGAAVATVTAVIFINSIRTVKLYSLTKIHSLTKNIIKPIILSVIMILCIYISVTSMITVTYWMLPIIFILFLGLYGLSLLATKSFDVEDINLLLQIEKKLNIDLVRIKWLLKKFL